MKLEKNINNCYVVTVTNPANGQVIRSSIHNNEIDVINQINSVSHLVPKMQCDTFLIRGSKRIENVSN